MFQFVTDKVCKKVAMSHRRFWCATPADRSVASFQRSVALRCLFAEGLDLEIAAILVSKN